MAKYDRETMLTDLRSMACEVHFNKVDGTIRNMHCTLRGELLPQNTDVNFLEEAHAKEENKDVIVVWDLQKNAWRSFRVDSVVYFNAIDNYD